MSRRAGRWPKQNFNPRFLDQDARLAFPKRAEKQFEVAGCVLAGDNETADRVARYQSSALHYG
jgi:hypothetical protein